MPGDRDLDPAAPHRKLAAILSADAVGYSRLMNADESVTVATLKEYREVMRRVIARRGGRVVNAPGDALLAEFPSAVEAVHCAVEIQQALTGRNVELAPERRMQFRIGVNVGDVIQEADGTIYGDGVNIAARQLSGRAPQVQHPGRSDRALRRGPAQGRPGHSVGTLIMPVEAAGRPAPPHRNSPSCHSPWC